MSADTKLPELPPPAWARDMHGETEVYVAAEMRDYGLACFEAGKAAERERIAAAWEHANGFDKHGVAKFIRAAVSGVAL